MNFKGNMRPILVLFATVFALLPSTFAMPVSAGSQPAPDEVIAWPGDEANHASYWEEWLGDGWTCEKVDREGSFTTDHFYGAIITKGGAWNNVFYNVPSGTDFTEVIRSDQPTAGISHYFKCNPEKSTPTPKPSATPTPQPSATPTPAPSNTPTPEPTKTPKPSATPTPQPSATPTPEQTKTPKPSATPTMPPTDTLDQGSNTGSSSTGIIVVFVALAMIAFLATMFTPVYGWRKIKK